MFFTSILIILFSIDVDLNLSMGYWVTQMSDTKMEEPTTQRGHMNLETVAILYIYIKMASNEHIIKHISSKIFWTFYFGSYYEWVNVTVKPWVIHIIWHTITIKL